MSNDPRDVYVSDLVRFIVDLAPSLPDETRRTVMRRFLPCEWYREDGRVRLVNARYDDLGASPERPLVDGFLLISGDRLEGRHGSFYQSMRSVGNAPDIGIEDGLDAPWRGWNQLHDYLLRLRDAGVLL